MQTFVSLWWLKYPTIQAASWYVGITWVFIILWVGIGFGVHTHPPSEYYATPTPVRPPHVIYLYNFKLRFYLTTVLVLDWSGFQSTTTWWRIRLVMVDVVCLDYLVPPSLLIAPACNQVGSKLVCPDVRCAPWGSGRPFVDCHTVSVS